MLIVHFQTFQIQYLRFRHKNVPKMTHIVIYFIELCTYFMPNVSKGVQTLRNPEVYLMVRSIWSPAAVISRRD